MIDPDRLHHSSRPADVEAFFAPAYIPLDETRLRHSPSIEAEDYDTTDSVRHILEYAAQRTFSDEYIASVLADVKKRGDNEALCEQLDDYYLQLQLTEEGRCTIGLIGYLGEAQIVSGANLTELTRQTIAAAGIVLVEHVEYLRGRIVYDASGAPSPT